MKIQYIGPIPQDFEEKNEFEYNMQLQKGDEFEFTEKQLTPRIRRKIQAMVENKQCVILDEEPTPKKKK